MAADHNLNPGSDKSERDPRSICTQDPSARLVGFFWKLECGAACTEAAYQHVTPPWIWLPSLVHVEASPCKPKQQYLQPPQLKIWIGPGPTRPFTFQQIQTRKIDYWGGSPPKNLLWKGGLAWFVLASFGLVWGLVWLGLVLVVVVVVLLVSSSSLSSSSSVGGSGCNGSRIRGGGRGVRTLLLGVIGIPQSMGRRPHGWRYPNP
jgi:hypothetical protein